jgi:hypothetical protein
MVRKLTLQYLQQAKMCQPIDAMGMEADQTLTPDHLSNDLRAGYEHQGVLLPSIQYNENKDKAAPAEGRCLPLILLQGVPPWPSPLFVPPALQTMPKWRRPQGSTPFACCWMLDSTPVFWMNLI